MDVSNVAEIGVRFTPSSRPVLPSQPTKWALRSNRSIAFQKKPWGDGYSTIPVPNAFRWSTRQWSDNSNLGFISVCISTYSSG